MWGEIKDILLILQLIISAVVIIFMKLFYSELKQRDIKIDNLDSRLLDVERNYIDRFNKVNNKQDEMITGIGQIRVDIGEVKQMVKDQKEFCSFVQENKR